MQSALRFIAVLNAALWLGGTVFFTFCAAPAIFSPAMSAMLPDAYRARVAELVIARLFGLQQICGGVALALWLVDYIRAGRLTRRLTLGVVGSLFALSLIGGYWLQPKMHQLEVIRYSKIATAEQRAQATSSFRAWHGFSQVLNVFALAGLVFYFWQMSRPPESPRVNPFFRPHSPADGSVPRML